MLQQALENVARAISATIERGRTQGWLSGQPAGAQEPKESGVWPTSTDGPAPMNLLHTRLELTAREMNVLWTLVGFELDPRLRKLLAHLADDVRAATIGSLLAVVFPAATAEGVASLSKQGALYRLGLIRLDPAEQHQPLSTRRVWIAERVLELALGTLGLDASLAKVASVDETPATALTELVVPADARSRLKSALADPATDFVLVQGASGTGRRSLLAAAVAADGSQALTIEGRAISKQYDDARVELRTLSRECRLLGLVPLVRDLDALGPAGDIPDRLDLVTSELGGRVLATSTHRISRRWTRIPVVIEIPPLDGADRARLWQRAIPVAAVEDAEILANLYPIAPALMRAVGASAMQLCGGDGMRPEHIETAIRVVLDDRLGGLATRVNTTQSWDDLVLPDDQITTIIELMSRVRERQRVYETWGFADKVGRGTGITAMFSGPPGTGKTMAAGLIAHSLHVELFQVDLSKIVSKWIGETEKNLAALFDAAESGHAILLFDEADALFGKRTDVKSSNDRHANQEVNYLLQRIERFTGICILTSNHESAIDEAFRRRLTVHVRFPVPDATERARLWPRLLPAKAPVASDLDFDALAERYVMSGGYIKNAVLRAAFLAADEGEQITGEHLEKAAQLEYEAMGKITSTLLPAACVSSL